MRTFLALSALAWGGYGLYCFASPHALADLAGIEAMSATGKTELRAMYGGVQSALGLFAALAVLNTGLRRPALLALAFTTGGLFTARLLGSLLANDFSSYTVAALGFESVYTVIAIAILRRSAHGPS